MDVGHIIFFAECTLYRVPFYTSHPRNASVLYYRYSNISLCILDKGYSKLRSVGLAKSATFCNFSHGFFSLHSSIKVCSSC